MKHIHDEQENGKQCLKRRIISRLHSDRHNKVRTPKQERSINTRKQIIEAGVKLFSEKGYHNTNSKEIASLAGVATGCFYSYFEDKKAVFIEAVALYEKQFDDLINSYLERASNSTDDTKSTLNGLIRCIIDAHDLLPGLHNELIHMRIEDEEIERIHHEKEKASIQNTYRQISSWKHKIRISDLETASVLVYNTIQRVVDIIVMNQSDLDKERLIHETVEMVNKYLFS